MNLTSGSITKKLMLFTFPMMAGSLLQQLYNIADTLIVGQFLGAGALAAVGSSYTVMVFLTSVLLGLCMGSSVLFSTLYGAGETERMKVGFTHSFLFIGGIAVLLEIVALANTEILLTILQVPEEIRQEMGEYLQLIFCGLFFTFLYNYFACLMRSVGNSVTPLIFLGGSAVLNIILDLLFIVCFQMGVAGAAIATVAAQGFSALGIALYFWFKMPSLRPHREQFRFRKDMLKQIVQYSLLTCTQQSIMNFGILMVQGLVNSFGVAVMAAFSAAVKIDSFAYLPLQEFGNAFSTFIAQNMGAGEKERIRKGLKISLLSAFLFAAVISSLVVIFGSQLMLIFVRPEETEIIRIGTEYLWIEGSCYFGIGWLFLLYGLYRGMGKPGFSAVLTVVSLGLRVLLAYALAPVFGTVGIWWAIPIGWILADAVGFIRYFVKERAPLR